MMMATADHVMTRASTRIQAMGELNVLYRSSVMVRLDERTGCALTSFLVSTMVVVVVEDRAVGTDEMYKCKQNSLTHKKHSKWFQTGSSWSFIAKIRSCFYSSHWKD